MQTPYQHKNIHSPIQMAEHFFFLVYLYLTCETPCNMQKN